MANTRPTVVTRNALVTLVVITIATTSCSGGSGGGSSIETRDEARVALLRIDQALRRLDEDAQNNGDGSKALKLGLESRIHAAERSVLARQAIEIVNASVEGRQVAVDPGMPGLLEELSDLPYLSDIAAAVRERKRGPTLAPPTSTALSESALTSGMPDACVGATDCCAVNCGNAALQSLALDVGLSSVGGLAEYGKWAVSDALTGVQCARAARDLKDCVAHDSCHHTDLTGFGLDCGLGLGGAVLKLGWLTSVPVKIIAFAASVTVSVTKANDVTYAECAAYQADACCPGKVRCGVECCGQGQACVQGRCLNVSTRGCSPAETDCGPYCCPSGWACPSSGDCAPPHPCPDGTSSCNGECCGATQSCSSSGDQLSCDACAGVTCGGVCCQLGQFCNLVGQCVETPDEGCGELCGTSCCAPGMSCRNGACEGAALRCGDTKCTPPQETKITCPTDCGSACNDGTCAAGETALGCSGDCSEQCNDGTCSSSELGSCPEDCGIDSSPDPGGVGGSGAPGTCSNPTTLNCNAFCADAQVDAVKSCLAQGGTVMKPLDLAGCSSSCECLQGSCPALGPCMADPTCPGCEQTFSACSGALASCNWAGDWVLHCLRQL